MTNPTATNLARLLAKHGTVTLRIAPGAEPEDCGYAIDVKAGTFSTYGMGCPANEARASELVGYIVERAVTHWTEPKR